MTSRFPTALEIAAWPEPNYANGITRKPLALSLLSTLTVIVVGFVTCRFFSRTVLVPALGFDDWTMLFAAICAVANNIMIIVSMGRTFKMGWHLWDIETSMLYGSNGIVIAAQFGMAAQLLTNIVASVTKVSILLTYLRIFPSKISRWFCWIMLAYTATLNFSCFFLVLFQCSPAETYWKIFKYFLTAKCLDIKAIYYFYTGQNIVSDFLIFLWPARELANVQISFRQRVTLISMFSVGVFICITGLVRVYYTHLYLTHFDTFWNGGMLLIMCALENCLGIACGCLPGCKPLMSRLFPRVFGTSSSGARDSNPRRPSNPIFGGKQFSSSTQQSHSFQLHSLDSQHADGIILKQQEFGVKTSRAVMDDGGEKGFPMRPQTSRRQSKVSVGRLVRRGDERIEEANSSSESQDLIILQGRAKEEEGKYSPWR